MNNESSRSENVTATTTNASDAPDTMSEGARILIEAMKTNPEFFVHGNKYSWVKQELANARGVSTRDHAVLTAAYDRYIVEPYFTERVITSTLGVDEQEETMRFKAEGRYSFGHTDPRVLLNSSGSLGIGTTASNFAPSHLAFPTQGGVNKMTITADGQLEIETPTGKRVL